MKVLGVNPGGMRQSHDSAAALVVDGRLVVAIEQERLSRKKKDGAFPYEAISKCLEYAQLEFDDIDYIAIPWFGYNVDSSYADLIFSIMKLRRGYTTLAKKILLSFSKERTGSRRTFSGGHLGFCVHGDMKPFTSLVKQNLRSVPTVAYVDHHRAHAATAYFLSGFDEAAVVSIDGGGYFYSTAVWEGIGPRLKMIRAESVRNTTGIYSRLSGFFNLGKFDPSGKLMGLSSYGKPDPEMTKRVKKYLLDADEGVWYKEKMYYNAAHDVFMSGLDIPPRQDNSIMEECYTDLAYAIQKELEKAYINIARYAVKQTGKRNICLAGGVALNCLANAALLENKVVDQLFVFPSAHDGGVAIGAALEVALRAGDNPKFELEHAYWGYEYSDIEILKWLMACKVSYSQERDIAGKVASLLTRGSIVGWFQGRMEIGPRALGNRSILADPRKKENWGRVNTIKRREHWRPFGPSILEERMGEYFENAAPSPYMLLSFKVKADKIGRIPAVIHTDGTTRPQTVNRRTNTLFWDLIKRFDELTGVPLVLNTSFNTQGEPLVCQPKDAISSFYTSGLDCLAIGNFLVKK